MAHPSQALSRGANNSRHKAEQGGHPGAGGDGHGCVRESVCHRFFFALTRSYALRAVSRACAPAASIGVCGELLHHIPRWIGDSGVVTQVGLQDTG